MKKYVSIGCWNVNGLKDKFWDTHFLNAGEDYDILCLQETKGSPDMYPYISYNPHL